VENLPESLLEVGDELLASRPHESFRLRELAALVPEKRGGVSHTAVFGHYNSMPDYLTALAARWWAVLSEQVRLRSSADTPVELGVRYVAFALENPHAFRLMYDAALWDSSEESKVSPHRQDEMRAARNACFEQFALAVRVLPWAQALSTDQVRLRARLFASLAHGLAMEFLDERLFGEVKDARARTKAQLRHARELLELAVVGAGTSTKP